MSLKEFPNVKWRTVCITNSWRILKDGITNPHKHFAVEEAIARLVDEGLSPDTLRVRYLEPSVWVGINQWVAEDVDVEACLRQGLPIVRRPNPGGAVYQDQNNFCFSLTFQKERLFSLLGIQDPNELYTIVGKAVTMTLQPFGVVAEISPVNDVTVGRRKIYGSAQLEFGSAFVHSGSFLINTDVKTMAEVLKPSELKFSDKGFFNVQDRVVTLSELVGRPVEVDEVIPGFVDSILELLRGTPTTSTTSLLPAEEELSNQLFEQKYSQSSWNFRTERLGTTVLSKKIRGGLVSIKCAMEGHIIQSLAIGGDFVTPNPTSVRSLARNLEGLTVGEAVGRVQQQKQLSNDLRGALTELINQVDKP